MVIKINNKKYEIDFNYKFVKFVMKKNNWTKFSEYETFLNKFVFEGDSFGPEHLEQFAELALLGISANKGKDVSVPLDNVVAMFWQDMSLMQDILAFFSECQPKTKEVVNPVARGN